MKASTLIFAKYSDATFPLQAIDALLRAPSGDIVVKVLELEQIDKLNCGNAIYDTNFRFIKQFWTD